jgi:DNA-binding response OmpR family regulator
MSGPAAVDVSVVRWPAQERMRRQLAELRRPRLLLVAVAADPPDVVDELEDWLREPVIQGDLVIRVRTLRRRAIETAERPVLDDGGLLRVGEMWVAIPDAQLALAHLLLARFGTVVRTEELVDAHAAANPTTPASITPVLGRLATRFDEVGLALTVVRGRGVVLRYRPFGE